MWPLSPLKRPRCGEDHPQRLAAFFCPPALLAPALSLLCLLCPQHPTSCPDLRRTQTPTHQRSPTPCAQHTLSLTPTLLSATQALVYSRSQLLHHTHYYSPSISQHALHSPSHTGFDFFAKLPLFLALRVSHVAPLAPQSLTTWTTGTACDVAPRTLTSRCVYVAAAQDSTSKNCNTLDLDAVSRDAQTLVRAVTE